jgi:hypothetical protein
VAGVRPHLAAVVACLSLLPAVGGCGGRADQPVPVPLPATADTGVAVIDGPTLIGFFPPPSAVSRTDSAHARRLAEFRAGLAQVRDAFERAGVRVYEQYVDTLVVEDAEGALQIYVPPPEDGGAGYYLAAPGQAPDILHGVRSDRELREAAVRYFHGRGALRRASRCKAAPGNQALMVAAAPERFFVPPPGGPAAARRAGLTPWEEPCTRASPRWPRSSTSTPTCW